METVFSRNPSLLCLKRLLNRSSESLEDVLIQSVIIADWNSDESDI
jgi:hypothetical protein